MVVLDVCQKLDAKMGHSPAEARDYARTHPCHTRGVVKPPTRKIPIDMAVSRYVFLDFRLNMLDLGTQIVGVGSFAKFVHGTTV